MPTDWSRHRRRFLQRILMAALPMLVGCSATGAGPARSDGSAASGGTAGAGGNAGTGGAAVQQDGTITWNMNGHTLTAPGYYETPSSTWRSFAFEIGADYAQSGRACTFWGQFAAVPPPPGTYEIVDYRAPATDGVFRAVCAEGFPSGTTQGPQSESGEIILARSEVGAIEGQFTLRATGVTGDITGTFRVGCRVNVSSIACAAHASGTEPGTCADLVACCARSFDQTTCMAKHDEAQPHGDAACANVLAFAKWSDCP